jgi:hypothetical protein
MKQGGYEHNQIFNDMSVRHESGGKRIHPKKDFYFIPSNVSVIHISLSPPLLDRFKRDYLSAIFIVA